MMDYGTTVRFSSYPERVNWVEKGAVMPVVATGNTYPSCYADSSRAAVESLLAIATGQWRSLSTQEMLGPTWKAYHPHVYMCGQEGGRVQDCFKYAALEGLCSNFSWPVGVVQPLSMDMPKVWLDGLVYLPRDEELLLQAIAQQPITATLDGHEMKRLGMIDFPLGKHALHSVLLAGYTLTSRDKYLFFQNNWGRTWENEGYGCLRLRPEYDCRVTEDLIYPVLDNYQSRLNSDMDKLGCLVRRSPLGVPASLRFPYVLSELFIGVQYKDGIILCAGGDGMLRRFGMNSIVGANQSTWKQIMDAGECMNGPIEILYGLSKILSDHYDYNLLERSSALIAGVYEGQIYLGMVMEPPSHLDGIKVLNLDGFVTPHAYGILEGGWHSRLTFEEGYTLVKRCARAQDKYDMSTLLTAHVTSKGISWFMGELSDSK